MPRERKAPSTYDPAAEAARPQWSHGAASADVNGDVDLGAAPPAAATGAARRERKAISAFDPTLEAAKPQWNHVPPPVPSPHKRWPWLSNVVKAQRRPKRKRAPLSPSKAFAFDANAATPSPHKRKQGSSPHKNIADSPEAAAEAAAAGLFYMFAEPAALPAPQDDTAEAHVLSYLDRFRRAPEDDEDEPETAPTSSPTKKHAANTQNDEQIMRSLRHVVFAEVGTGHFKECCLGLREFIKACSPRAFKGMKEDKLAYDLAPIVRHLQERWNSGALSCMPTPGHVALEVEALADACKSAGFSRSLSFSSKALNMLGLPVPPFSDTSAASLNLPKGLASYGRYLDAWTTKYAKVRREYEAAAAMHIRGVKQGKFIVISKSYMERRLGSEWFGMRGFDVALQVKV